MPTGRGRRRGRAVSGAAAAVTLAAGLLAAGCGGSSSSGPVAIASTALDPDSAATCRQFVAALPASVARQKSRATSPADAPGRAYGDPAITVTCGVGVPSTYSRDASCETFDGVGWYVPDSVYTDQDAAAVLTAVGYRPIVQLVIPASYRPDGPFLAIGELSGDVKKHLRLVHRCTS